MAPVADDELTAVWERWDGAGTETFILRRDGGAWTAEGRVSGVDVHYVLRLADDWRLRQFLLFRDLDDPDLWLATDIAGRWGEMNGVYRRELDGCVTVDLEITPFTSAVPALQLGHLAEGEHADVHVARVDVETLRVMRVQRRYVRLAERSWRVERHGRHHDLTLDEHGLTLDIPGAYRRIA